MKLFEFTEHLKQHPKAELYFVLPDGGRIAPHAHITEVGRIDKQFVDCGGTVRRLSFYSLQAWEANDIDHRLSPEKLAGIIEKAVAVLGSDDLDVEIEYEDRFISQFPVESVEEECGNLLVHLTTKHTDCLAKDVCLPSNQSEACCSGNSGCC